jgi:hypothetical protein
VLGTYTIGDEFIRPDSVFLVKIFLEKKEEMSQQTQSIVLI